MAATSGPRVALLAHRFAEAHPTGIGRYYREMSLALLAGDGAPLYELASPPEPRPPAWLPPGTTHRTVGSSRQALLLACNLTGRPALDARLGSPDLVHLLHPWAATPTRAPLVVTLHDLMPVLHPEWYPRKARWAGRRGLEAMAEHATTVVAVSSFVADQARQHLGVDDARLTVIPEGIPAGFRAAPHRASAEVAAAAARHGVSPGRYLVAVGQVSPRKNLSPVLEALRSLPAPVADGPRRELLLCGPDGVDAATVHRSIDALGLAERVHCAGFVPDDELPALVAGALALVHPSLDEGFGLTPLEAMAAGTPVIASTAGALPEVIGEAGLLVDPREPESWAAAIASVRADPPLRAELVQRGRARCESFTWQLAAERLRALHRRVLAPAGEQVLP